MAQADGVVANGTGSAVRSDINNQYAALWSNHSGSTEPSSGKVAYQFWADTNTSILKIRNSANNAWINLFTLAGGIDVDAASNFNEDVTFTGASANVTWDKSVDDFIFNDNAKAAFGTSSDLTIFHNGSASYIDNTGDLFIQGDAILLEAENGENYFKGVANGSVELYYDNSKKFQTSNTGVLIGKDSDDYSIAGVAIRTAGEMTITRQGDLITTRRLNIEGGHFSFRNVSGSQVGSIETSTSATSFNESSDYRLKENEVAISDGITRLKTLKPYRFNFKTDSSKTVDGFFAHEVTAVPEAISGEKDGAKMQQIDKSKLVPLLTAAIQEAIGKIEILETKVAALES